VKTYTYRVAPGDAARQITEWARRQPMLKVRERGIRVPDVRRGEVVGTYAAVGVAITAPDDAPLPVPHPNGVIYEWGTNAPWTPGPPMVYIANAPRGVVDRMIRDARNSIDAWDAYAASWRARQTVSAGTRRPSILDCLRLIFTGRSPR